MKKMYLFAVASAVVMTISASQAHAEGPSKVWIGGNVGLSPVGTLDATVGNATASEDATTAVAFLPSQFANLNVPYPSGFMIGFGGGIGVHVTPRLQLTGEISYQLRYPSETVNGTDFDFHANYLTFAVGLLAGID